VKLQHLILFFSLLMACSNSTRIPPDLYNREDMAVIMRDVYILEFKVPELYLSKDSSREVYDLLEKKLFEEKGYDSLKYKKSLNFYLEHTDHLEYIYTIIADSLSLQDKMNQIP